MEAEGYRVVERARNSEIDEHLEDMDVADEEMANDADNTGIDSADYCNDPPLKPKKKTEQLLANNSPLKAKEKMEQLLYKDLLQKPKEKIEEKTEEDLFYERYQQPQPCSSGKLFMEEIATR